MSDVRRREFIALLGGAAAVWPRAARAEQGGGQGAFAPFTSTDGTLPAGQIIPPSRMTDWTKPGLTARGGIPYRTTIYKTLSPLGGTQDDDPQIQAAIDACPDGQVVQLTAGVFRINGGSGWRILMFNRNNITLRGVGPGQALAKGNGGVFVEDPTATQLIKVNAQNTSPIILINVYNAYQNNVSVNLTVTAPRGAYSVTVANASGFKVGMNVLIDQNTDNHPDVFWGTQSDGPGGGSRRWYTRQDRSLGQIVEITAITGNVLTFATPLHCTFATTYIAQVTRFNPDSPTITGVGIEDLYIYGICGGPGQISMHNAAYCWVKHCDLHWFRGSNINMSSCYRCEIRDSFMHEALDPNPGGAAYILDMNTYTSDCLIENNIMWYANKNIVVRPGGGGNVIAYNYMDDALGANYPNLPESALNVEHMTTSHMELCEGNYAPNYACGSGFGNTIDITLFRNHLSALRAASPPLNTFVNGRTPYCDIGMPRFAASVAGRNWRQNFVGNVLGKQDQKLISIRTPTYSASQTSWVYEQLDRLAPDGQVPMWYMGAVQSNPWTFEANTYQTILREGNWDWFTKRQRWHGIGGRGSTDTSTPKPIPNSLYLSSKPAFFGNNPWPWVDPSTGITSVLPAKARFDAGTPNLLS